MGITRKSTEDLVAEAVDSTMRKYDAKIRQYESKCKDVEKAIEGLDALILADDKYKILIKQRQFYQSEVRHYIKDRATFAVRLTAFFASKKSKAGGGIRIEMTDPSVVSDIEQEEDTQDDAL